MCAKLITISTVRTFCTHAKRFGANRARRSRSFRNGRRQAEYRTESRWRENPPFPSPHGRLQQVAGQQLGWESTPPLTGSCSQLARNWSPISCIPRTLGQCRWLPTPQGIAVVGGKRSTNGKQRMPGSTGLLDCNHAGITGDAVHRDNQASAQRAQSR